MNTQNYSVESADGQAIGEGMTWQQACKVAQENANHTGEPRYVIGLDCDPEEFLPEVEA